MDVAFSSPIASGDFSVSEIKFDMADTFYYSGIASRQVKTATLWGKWLTAQIQKNHIPPDGKQQTF